MLCVILLVIILTMAPTVAFFLWAWGVKIKEQRKLSGTLPEWQDLPLTWLGIAGLATWRRLAAKSMSMGATQTDSVDLRD